MPDTEAKRIVRCLVANGVMTEAAATGIRDLYRDEVALDLGRDCIAIGVVPFLRKLVGETNTRELVAEIEENAVREYRFG